MRPKRWLLRIVHSLHAKTRSSSEDHDSDRRYFVLKLGDCVRVVSP